METKPEHAIVEIMGHVRLAGRIHEERRFGVDLLRVDVPAIGDRPGFTRFFGGAAIFSLTPCDEATALSAAAEIRVGDYSSWATVRSVPALIEGEVDVESDDDFNALDDDEQDWPDERVRLAQPESADPNSDVPF